MAAESFEGPEDNRSPVRVRKPLPGRRVTQAACDPWGRPSEGDGTATVRPQSVRMIVI